MSALKIQTNISAQSRGSEQISEQVSELNQALLKQISKLVKECILMKSELLDNIEATDVIARDVEEVVVLREFRQSRYQSKLEKMKTLKRTMQKSFKMF